MATQQQLTEAETAYHKLITGKQVVSVMIDGVQTQYKPGEANLLLAYIRQLKIDLGVSGHGRVPPARVC